MGRSPAVATRKDLLALLPGQSTGAEIGCLHGGFAVQIESRAKPQLLYLVDCWCQVPGLHPQEAEQHRNLRRVLVRFKAEIARGQVRPIAAASGLAATFIEDGSLDWVYIDADHAFTNCLADLEAWYPKVRRRGLIMGHDHLPETPSNERRQFGVARAVRTFRETRGITTRLRLTNERWPSFWFTKQ